MNEGYVKLHRSLLDWEWYTDRNVFKLFLHMLLKANHKENKWRGIDVKRGQFISSLEKLSIETGLTIREIRTAKKKLEKTQEVTSKGHSNFTLFTVKNYDRYQDSDKQTTNERQTSDNKQEGKEGKEIYICEELEKFAAENFEENQTAYLLKTFFRLSYIPAKEETVKTFRRWFKEMILDKHTFQNVSEITSIIDQFESYWLDETTEKQRLKKNWKSTFMNNPYLNKYKK